MIASTTTLLPTVRTILGALAEQLGATAPELALASGLGRSTVSKALAQLETDGFVSREIGGRAGARRLADRWRLLTGQPAPTEEASSEATATRSAAELGGAAAAEPVPTSEPEAIKTSVTHLEAGVGRLGKGQLRGLVLVYLQARASEEHSPSAVAKALGRSAGAVGNALVKLTIDGTVIQTSVTPRRFVYPT